MRQVDLFEPTDTADKFVVYHLTRLSVRYAATVLAHHGTCSVVLVPTLEISRDA